jgi:hypothetical protein
MDGCICDLCLICVNITSIFLELTSCEERRQKPTVPEPAVISCVRSRAYIAQML